MKTGYKKAILFSIFLSQIKKSIILRNREISPQHWNNPERVKNTKGSRADCVRVMQLEDNYTKKTRDVVEPK